jgi:hypothetical protein
LLALIGEKEVEIYLLRKELAAAKAALAKVAPREGEA